MAVKIAPSVLSADFANLERDLNRISGADMVHIDVMDGHFVPNISLGIPVLASISKATDLFLDVHLMISQPVRYIEAFCQAGADSITIHVEADTSFGIEEALRKCEEFGVKKGLALRPMTKASGILPYLSRLDMVLVMTVEPGFGGQSFMESQLETISQVHRLIQREKADCVIQVDGGITVETIGKVVSCGASVAVAGSSVFGHENPQLAIELLRG